MQYTPEVRFSGVIPLAEAGVASIRLLVDGGDIGFAELDRTASPQRWSLTGVPTSTGNFTLTVVATDNIGQSTDSSQQVALETLQKGQTYVAPGAVAARDQLEAAITRFDTSTGQLTLNTTQSGLEPGQVVQFDDGPALPGGLLVRVVSVTVLGELTVVATERAVLTDLFLQLQISDTRRLTPPAEPEAATGALEFRSRLSTGTKPYKITAPEDPNSAAHATVEGAWVLDTTTDVTVEWVCVAKDTPLVIPIINHRVQLGACGPKPTAARVGGEVTLTALATLTAEREFEDQFARDFYNKSFPSFKIVVGAPPFVIWITPQLTLSTVVDINVTGSLTATLPKATLKLGGYQNYAQGQSNGDGTNELSLAPDPIRVELVGNLQSSVLLAGRLAIIFYQLGGPTVTAAAGAYADVEGKVLADSSGQSDACFGYKIGVRVKGDIGAKWADWMGDIEPYNYTLVDKRLDPILTKTATCALPSASPSGASSGSSPTPEPSPTGNPAGLLINGDFERPELPAGEDLLVVSPGGTVDGWTAGDTGTVDHIGSFWTARSGKRSIDLNGDNPGSIYQDIATEPGAHYELSYAYSINPDPSSFCGNEGAAKSASAIVSFGGQEVSRPRLTVGTRTLSDMQWLDTFHDVVAEGPVTRVQFASADTPGPCGLAVDNVTIRRAPR